MIGAPAHRSRRFAVACVLVGGWSVVACEKCRRGDVRIDTPNQCRTSLLEVKSCRGEDRSLQECLYHFRADGVPRPEVCRAFLAVADAGSDDSLIPPGAVGCNELSPLAWKRVGCADFKLPLDLTCFVCTEKAPEANRTTVQAYSADCDRAVVLKGCNVDLATVR